MVNIISVRTLRPQLSKVLDNVYKKFDRYIVTKRGRPEAILMSVAEYESLIETLEIESDAPLMRRLKKAALEIQAGKGKSLAQIDKELGIV
jgi:prevent-host-death family protein